MVTRVVHDKLQTSAREMNARAVCIFAVLVGHVGVAVEREVSQHRTGQLAVVDVRDQVVTLVIERFLG